MRLIVGLVLAIFTVAGHAGESGAAAFRRGDFTTAIERFARKAELGDRVAQNNLGVMYLKGHGVTIDYARAYGLFSSAASHELPGAMFNLGIMNLRGYGRAVDLTAAASWFERAAALDDREAQFFLGLLYYKGEGVIGDPRRARDWFQKSAAAGLPAGKYNLAMLELQNGQESAAMVWLESAAAQGYEPAKLGMARLALAQSDDSERAKRAYEMLRDMADSGNAEAQMHLGLANTFGHGVAVDYEEGRFWLRQSGLQGFAPAQMNLGAVYAEGIGTDKDVVQAYAWLKLAAPRNALASKALDLLLEELTADQRAAAETLALAG